MTGKLDGASTEPRYTIEIDEEGYPLFDGLRVQDEAWTRALLASFHRRADSPRRLLAECEGEACWVNAFDAPWVARLAESVADDVARFRLAGGGLVEVPIQDLKVDEWDRLHAIVGPHAIPLVCSRTAQATLWEAMDEAALAAFRPGRFRRTDFLVNERATWEKVYRDGEDGWERGGPHPTLVEAWPRLERSLKELSPSPALLVPAAGRAHDAVLFERSGFRVTALDFAEDAEREFRALYPTSKLRYERADLFEFFSTHPAASFEGVFDVAALCAIDPERRAEYLRGLVRLLKPGALYFGVFYLGTLPGGPPYGMTQWELREYAREGFDILEWKWLAPTRGAEGLWAVLRRR